MPKKQIHLNRFPVLFLLFILISFYACATGLKTQKAESVVTEPFRNEIDTFIQWDQKNSVPENAILFVGSSSIRMWKTASAFPELTIINRGFGGSQISNVNHYYDVIVKKYTPTKIVFYAGDNDIAAGKSTEQVFKDFQSFIEKVERDLPETPVFYLPIKPSLNRWQLWPQMAAANEKIRQFTETRPNLFYVDTAMPMLNKNSEPNPDLFLDDGLHLNEKGYELWNEILRPFLKNSNR